MAIMVRFILSICLSISPAFAADGDKALFGGKVRELAPLVSGQPKGELIEQLVAVRFMTDSIQSAINVAENAADVYSRARGTSIVQITVNVALLYLAWRALNGVNTRIAQLPALTIEQAVKDAAVDKKYRDALAAQTKFRRIADEFEKEGQRPIPSLRSLSPEAKVLWNQVAESGATPTFPSCKTVAQGLAREQHEIIGRYLTDRAGVLKRVGRAGRGALQVVNGTAFAALSIALAGDVIYLALTPEQLSDLRASMERLGEETMALLAQMNF